MFTHYHSFIFFFGGGELLPSLLLLLHFCGFMWQPFLNLQPRWYRALAHDGSSSVFTDVLGLEESENGGERGEGSLLAPFPGAWDGAEMRAWERGVPAMILFSELGHPYGPAMSQHLSNKEPRLLKLVWVGIL